VCTLTLHLLLHLVSLTVAVRSRDVLSHTPSRFIIQVLPADIHILEVLAADIHIAEVLAADIHIVEVLPADIHIVEVLPADMHSRRLDSHIMR